LRDKSEECNRLKKELE